MANQVIAIDGPAAAGKSTVARELANQLGALLFDTGTLYRAVTLAAIRNAIPASDGPALAKLASSSNIEVRPPTVADERLYDVLLDEEDVTWAIRDPAVDAFVSPVSAHPEVREALLDIQRRIASSGRVVIVGRDIGTVVVPDARIKIFLEASVEERARRRYQELSERGQTATLAEVLNDIKRRDAIDTQRNTSPLRPAPDAVIVTTDGLSVPQVVSMIKHIVEDASFGSVPCTQSVRSGAGT